MYIINMAKLSWCCEFQPLERIGRSAIKDGKVPDDLLVISCEEDLAVCTPLLETGENNPWSTHKVLAGD